MQRLLPLQNRRELQAEARHNVTRPMTPTRPVVEAVSVAPDLAELTQLVALAELVELAAPWMARGLCRQSADADRSWFPSAVAKDLCNRCPVRRDCLSQDVLIESKDRVWRDSGRLDWELKAERKQLGRASFQATAAGQ